MKTKDSFDFLNSNLWLESTQNRYLPLEQVKYSLKISNKDFPEIKKKIEIHRKMSAVPFFLKSINKKFWYFESDIIKTKIYKIKGLGDKLIHKINNYTSLKEEFCSDANIEEALASAIYEGANSSRAKAKNLLTHKKRPKNKDEQMLVNNFLSLDWIIKNQSIPLSKKVILNIHQIVTQLTLEEQDGVPGKFRDDKVFVGSHEGTDFNKIDEAIDEVISLLNHPSRYMYEGFLQGIFLHYFIAYIHPFFDGNGRTARSLFYFYGIKNNLKFINLVSISSDLKLTGNQYVKAFDLVKDHDLDMTYFIIFSLNMLENGLDRVKKKVDYLIQISEHQEKLGLTGNQVLLLQKMAINKFITFDIEGYAQSIKKSREIARRDLIGLLDKKLLKVEKQANKMIFRINKSVLKERINSLNKSSKFVK